MNNKIKIFRKLHIILIIVFCLAACKKTSYVSGEPPVFDTTGAGPVTADPPVLEGEISKTLVFDGLTNYIAVPDHPDFDVTTGESFTVTCMVKMKDLRFHPIFRKRISNALGYEMAINAAGVYHVNIRGNPGNLNIGTNATVTSLVVVDTWYHFAFVVSASGNIVRIYVDGILNNSTTHAQIGSLNLDAVTDLHIGFSNQVAGRLFAGEMDDIRVFSKALSETEIKADMKKLTVDGSTPDLLAAWDFEDIEDDIVPDISENGHDGKLVGNLVLGERVKEE